MNPYVTKAMDAYPYQLQEAVEALTYALSYDEGNVLALVLMGRVYAEQMHNYAEAIRCYEEAMGCDMEAVVIYPYFVRALILYEEFDKARKLIEYAMSVKGVDKVDMIRQRVIIEEKTGHYNKAIKWLKEMRKMVCNDGHDEWMAATEKRLKSK